MTPSGPESSGRRVPLRRTRNFRYAKLKPGPGQSSEEVRTDQRARLYGATIELTAERGYSGLTVRGISRTAGVSTRTLYAHFENVEECFAATYRWAMRQVEEQLAEAMAGGGEWGDRIGVWLRALTELAAEQPHGTHLLLVDAYDGGPAMLREIEAATARLERSLAADTLRSPLSQAIVAGVEHVVRTRVLEGREAELPRLAGELIGWALSVSRIELPPPQDSTPGPAKPPLPPQSTGGRDPSHAVFESIGGDRGRILSAVAKLSVTKGYWDLTTTDLRREAGVSRRAFDALFDSVADCYAQAGLTLSTAAARKAIAESADAPTWPARIERLVNRICIEIEASALHAQLGFIGVFTPGAPGLLRRERLLQRSSSWLLAFAPGALRPTQVAAEGSTAASWRMIHVELTAKGGGRPSEAAGLIHRLYLGQPSA